MFITNALLAGATLFAGTQAHLVISNPVPYASPGFNNSPLKPDGSDYPCKFTGGFKPSAAQGTVNKYATGEEVTMKFKGTTVHGGGSCQISIADDLDPTKDTKFKVIHSVMGGCPVDAEGNLPGNSPDAPLDSKIKFSIPSSVKAGKYTMAWTWINRTGGVPEMYMNCFPVEVTGGSKKRWAPRSTGEPKSKRAEFPNIFIANVKNVPGYEYCEAELMYDVTFPNPGESVAFLGTPSRLKKAANACKNGGTGGSGGGPAPSAPAGSSVPAPSNGGPVPSDIKVPSATGGAPAPTGPAPTGPAPTSAAPQPTGPSGSAPAPVPTEAVPTGVPAPGGSEGGSGGNGSAQSGACSVDGDWNCIGGSQFQRCASGKWSVAQAVSAGTKCVGSGSSFKIEAAVAKRGSHHAHRRARHAY
ncbi:hypothetical protein FQN57_000643 [Myotisia sp. PD_48]|nr:hypothetical protein FQN57_000643 [Myotisia sp. PD_48]